MHIENAPDVHGDLAPLAFLLGTWAGAGLGGYPTIDSFRFGQELAFTHNGKPFLAYTSRSWLLDDDGNRVRPLATETGFWRARQRVPGSDKPAEAEVLLTHPTGFVEIYLGEVDGAKVELRTDMVGRTATAKDYSAGHRLYGLVEGDLMWAYDMAAVGQPLQPHLSAQLRRADAATT